MKTSTIVLGFLAAAVSASMALAQPAATDKSAGTAPASTAPSGTAAPAKAPPAKTAPAKTSPGNAPAAMAPAGTTPSTTAPSATSQGAGTGKDAAAAGKEPHRGSAAVGGTPALLTPDEASAHRAAMRSFKNVDECNAYFVKYHKLVDDRAKEKGVAAPADRGSPCARMAARGFHP